MSSALIKKFLRGETSVKDEILISEYFQSEKVNTEHLHLKPYFDYMKTLKEQEVEINVLEIIELAKSSAEKRKVSSIIKIVSSAAAIILFVALFIQLLIRLPDDNIKNSDKDVAKLEAEAEFAILFLTTKVNEGSNFFKLKRSPNENKK